MEPKERAGDPQVVKERGADLDLYPTPTQARRSPDLTCEVRKGCGEMDPSRWEKRSYLRADVQDLQTLGDFTA